MQRPTKQPAEAYAQILEQYRPMVWKIAGKIAVTATGARLGTVEDLAQEGMLGLMHAARNYNPRHGSAAKFMTYAYRCVHQWISRACRQAGLIRVPDHVICAINGWKFGNAKDVPADRKEAGMRAMGAVEMPEFFGAAARDDVQGEVERREAVNTVRRLLSRLSSRDAAVLRMRYLEYLEYRSLQETADLLSVSKERVRQLQCRALTKLREMV